MPTNYENRVPGDNKELLYWLILKYCNEIWRTRKKTKSAFQRSRVLTNKGEFDQGLLCNCDHNLSKHA
jgi:hypothetical protein